MRRDVKRAIDFSITQDSHAVLTQRADRTGIQQLLRTDLGALLKTREVPHINGREFFLECRVGKAALRYPPMERHLAALKSAFLTAARTRPHSLISAPCRFSVSRSGSAADALRFMCRPRIRSKCI